MRNVGILSNRFLSRTNPEYLRAKDDGGDVLNSPEINKLMMQMVDMGIADNLKLWVHSGLVETRVSGSDTFVPKAYDISGEENDAVQATAGNQPELVSNGMEFDGSDDFFTIANSSYNNFPNQFTIMVWAMLKATKTYSAIIVKRHSQQNTGAIYSLYFCDPGSIHYDIRDNTRTYRFRGTYEVSNYLNTWHNIVITRDSENEAKIYHNVNIKDTNTLDGNISPTGQPLYLGKHSQNSTQELNGALNDIRIFNKALSTSEISAIYNATKHKYGHT